MLGSVRLLQYTCTTDLFDLSESRYLRPRQVNLNDHIQRLGDFTVCTLSLLDKINFTLEYRNFGEQMSI